MTENRFRRRLRLISWLVLTILIVAAAGIISWAWLQPFRDYPQEEKFVLIERGSSSYQVAQQLEREGIVSHWAWFLAYLKTMKRSRSLQAGEYRFDRPLSITQVADKLIRGLIYYHEVTVPEGYSLFDIAELFEKRGLITSEQLLEAAKRTELISDFAQDVENLEGFLFPDTYYIARTTGASEVVGKMVDRFRQVYDRQFAEQVRRSPMSLKEVVTLASLIEKETGVDEERELVSAVFHNRLSKRMPLQCDPTVIYAARLKGTFRGEIYRTDLEDASPYNTYRRLGLPPGPIANPGIRSLEAALSPAKVDYLYFVSNNQGGHTFSVTLDQHNRAVTAYRSGLRRGSKKAVQPTQGDSE